MVIVGILSWRFLGGSLGFLTHGLEMIGRLPVHFQSQNITHTFRESITRISATDGDILEVASLESDETVTKMDMKSLFGSWVYLGTTISEVRSPVVYRYHIKLSDEWKLHTASHRCTVIAPPIRPTLPPAIRTDGIQKKSEAGWLRFNADENLAALERGLTPEVEKRAGDSRHIQLVREPARQAVAKFVRRWLISEDQWKREGLDSIVVVFADEPAARNPSLLEAAPPALQLEGAASLP